MPDFTPTPFHFFQSIGETERMYLEVNSLDCVMMYNVPGYDVREEFGRHEV